MTAPLPGHTASNLSRVATPPLLKVNNLSLEYRTSQRVVRATHQVSFEVDRADRFVLLGPSGCGKSTLLKAVAGLSRPRRGRFCCKVSQSAVRAPTASWCSRSSTSCRHGRR